MPVYGPRGVQPVQARGVQPPTVTGVRSGQSLPRTLLYEQFDGFGGLTVLGSGTWSVSGGSVFVSSGALATLPTTAGVAALLVGPTLPETYVDVTFNYVTPATYQFNSAESMLLDLAWNGSNGAGQHSYRFSFVPDASSNGFDNASITRISAGASTIVASIADGLAYSPSTVISIRCVVRSDGTLQMHWATGGNPIPATPQLSYTDTTPPSSLGTQFRFGFTSDTPIESHGLDSITVLPAFTVSTALPTITTTGSNTLANITSAAAAQNTITATGAATLADITSNGTASATAGVTATGASTLANITSSGSAQNVIAGTGAVTLGNITSNGTVTLLNPVTTTGANTLANITSAGSGSVGSAVSASGAVTLDNITSNASVQNRITGSAANTLANITSAGAAQNRITGTATNVLANITSSAAVQNRISVTAAVTLANVISNAAAQNRITASGAVTLGDVTSAGTVSVAFVEFLTGYLKAVLQAPVTRTVLQPSVTVRVVSVRPLTSSVYI